MKQNTKKYIVVTVALALAAALLFAVWYFTRPATVQGSKTLTIEVVHRDGTKKAFELHTDAEYLSTALMENGLIEGEETAFGLYITVCDGETADVAAEEWWCLTKNGEMLLNGADAERILDGGQYELTLTVGFDY